MKKLISYFTATYLMLICFSSAYGQWNTNGGLPNKYAETRNFPPPFNIRSVGVGNFFSNGFEPMSALHVNTNFLDLSPNFPKGDVFMTTGPANEDNSWRMFTGANNGTERFSITTPANSDDAVLSTVQNGAMMFATNGIQRLHVNENRNTVLNAPPGGGVGIGVVSNGYVGIGPNTNSSPFGQHINGLWTDKGPYTLLHLNGALDGEVAEDFGFRSWMKTGISFTSNIDFSYIGHRKIINNLTEFVINWSNDASVGSENNNFADDMVFRFTSKQNNGIDPNPGGGGSSKGVNNFTKSDDVDGRHIARFTATGEFGLGPNFGYTSDHPDYVRPQSLLHMSSFNNQEAWLQITNQDRTEQTEDDGLRLGIRGGASSDAGYLRWQENTPFIIQSDWNVNPGGINNGERMRISSINSNGVPHPNGIADNTTRVSISHRGNQEVSEPRSLLHMGYNTSASGDGWRKWMDVGTFINNGSDNMYLGLKKEKSGPDDRYDAVVNWGDNQTAGGGIGPDNLRFIFTSTVGTDNPPANSLNGLEIARMIPTLASTLTAPNYGMMGIGNFAPGSLNIVDAKLDIDGDLRIRTVTEDSTLVQVLVIDSNDHNRVHWRSIDNLGGGNVTANNGLSVDPLNAQIVQLGNDVGQTTGQLLNDREVPMNNQNIYFSQGSSLTKNRIGIGTLSPSAKMHIVNPNLNDGTTNTTLAIENLEPGINLNQQIIGLSSSVLTPNTNMGAKVKHIGGVFRVAESDFNIGLDVYAENNFVFGSDNSAIVADASGTKSVRSYGITSTARDAGNLNYGVLTGAYGASNVANYGIYASASGSINANYAGWFDGDVFINSGDLITSAGNSVLSDAMFKKNISSLTNASDILNQLRPKTYNLDSAGFTQFGFNTKQHIGFIAQQVQTILPDLVSKSVMPAQYDSLGNETSPQVDYLALNYQEFIPLLVAGYQGQQSDLNSKDSIIDNLEDRLSALEECIRAANLCTTGNRMSNPDAPTTERSIELTNVNSIILDQNLPNPFAENTIITYNIPEDVNNAKLLFYDLNGRVIKEMIIEERGASKLTVYGENLKTGIYTYSLIADGKLIATKKMVKQ
jgi:hypothetical protein